MPDGHYFVVNAWTNRLAGRGIAYRPGAAL